MSDTLKYVVFFQVEGRSTFPIDMLRYDRCCPDQQRDVAAIGDEASIRTVGLVRYALNKSVTAPTTERWASFGWHVVPGSIRIYKL